MHLARFASISLGAIVIAFAWSASAATPEVDINVQTAPGGFKYVTGGVGDAEQAIMSSRFNDYSYKLVNVKSGPEAKFVANVHVTILNDQGEKVLETTTDGPWLIANLPAGEYTIKANFEKVTKTRHVKLHAGADQRMVLDWRPNGQTPAMTNSEMTNSDQ